MVVRKLLSAEEWAALIKSCKSLSQVRNVHALLTSRHSLFKGTAGIYLSNILIQIYGRCGSVHDAFQVFDAIPCKNGYSWMLMLAACVQNRHFVEATCLFRKMPDPDVFSGATMIGVFARRGCMEEAKKTFDRVPKNVVTWNALLAAYAQKRHLDAAAILFQKMPMQDAVSWGTMVSAYNQMGLIEEAKRFFDWMPERSPASWTSMLVAYAHIGHLQEAKALFDDMPAKDVVSWTALLASYAQNGQLLEAMILFDRIPMRDLAVWAAMLISYSRHGHIEDAKSLFEQLPSQDAYTMNAMLAGYAQNGCISQAKEMFDAMPEQQLRRDVVTWNALFAGYAQNDFPKEALSTFEQMPMWDVLSWNTMLATYAHNGHIDTGRLFFSGMPLRDLQAWNTMLGAYGGNGHFKLAFGLFQDMQLEGIKPDDVSFICLFLGCNHGGTVSSARSCFISIIQDYGMKPMKIHYSCMIDILGRAGHLKDAEELIDSMPFMPDGVDWHCLLSSCKIHSDQQRGSRAASHAVDIGSSDSGSYALFESFLKTRIQS